MKFPDFHHALILGGAASGKSVYAEQLAQRQGKSLYYIATAGASAEDAEWQAKLQRHRQRRDSRWQTYEEPLYLASLLKREGKNGDRVLLVDCLTLWLYNLLSAGMNVDESSQQLCEVLTEVSAQVILVSNELGMGLVPAEAETRAFRDAQGSLNQRLATEVDCVQFVVAGLSLSFK